MRLHLAAAATGPQPILQCGEVEPAGPPHDKLTVDDDVSKLRHRGVHLRKPGVRSRSWRDCNMTPSVPAKAIARLGRLGARCRPFGWSVSPSRLPNPPCASSTQRALHKSRCRVWCAYAVVGQGEGMPMTPW